MHISCFSVVFVAFIFDYEYDWPCIMGSCYFHKSSAHSRTNEQNFFRFSTVENQEWFASTLSMKPSARMSAYIHLLSVSFAEQFVKEGVK